ncbi:MAG: hypothetical protein ACUVRU_03950 [Anaerolineae bacterium]
MSSNPTRPPDPADDWQLPGETKSPAPRPSAGPTPEPDIKSGAWENADEEIKPASPQARPDRAALQPIIDALRVPFGSLWDDPRSRPLILVSLLALIAVCGLSCFVLSLALVENAGRLATSAPTAPSAAQAQPTLPITAALRVVANDTPVPPGLPNRLIIRNATFDIVALQPDSRGEWSIDLEATQTAYWAAGSLVNYVIGLPANQANRETIDSLRNGDLILLDTLIGTLRYRVSQSTTVSIDEPLSLQDQSRPQLTLMLLGDRDVGEGARRVIIAAYTDESTANSLTTLGAVINLGDVRVRTLSARLVPGANVGLPAGQNYYQVNVEISSLITRVLDAAQFTAQLVDVNGARYPVSEAASSADGGLGWTRGALSPGQTITATSGFQVPVSLPGPRLEWNFAIEANSPYIARVTLPYEQIVVEPTALPTEAPIAEVSLLNVSISPEGNELRIVGTVRNLTNRFLPVSLRDFNLESGGNLTALNASLPALPWSITPGETLAFQLTFSRPPGGQPAIFRMFNQSFEISGL